MTERPQFSKSWDKPQRRTARRGRLQNIMNMPIDIFATVCEHLSPRDLRTLSLTARRLRELLMSRDASHIWRGCRAQITGLPDCPPDLSEPQYARLIFTTECYGCGGRGVKVDYFNRVRYCIPCYELHILSAQQVDLKYPNARWCIAKYISNEDVTSAIFKGRIWCKLARRYYHEPTICQLLKEAPVSESEEQSESWTPFRERWTARREMLTKTGLEMHHWAETYADNRREELQRIYKARRESIEQRLMELGWDENEIPFPNRQYEAMVKQPRPLTEQGWDRILRKLTPILEDQRRQNRLHQRRRSLRRFYSQPLEDALHQQGPSFLSLTPFIGFEEFMKLPPVLNLLIEDTEDVTEKMWRNVVDDVWQNVLGPDLYCKDPKPEPVALPPSYFMLPPILSPILSPSPISPIDDPDLFNLCQSMTL
ncbi:hypothetical protein FRB99_004347 [Tulasnella sp. 403]|nr:hypothetical protein FRB99_004347 [Tulasnella sp. 403]